MLMSAVPDPTAFDKHYFDEFDRNFDELYPIQAEDFLKGIVKNGLLILDSEKKLQTTFITRIKEVPIKYRQRLQIRFEELWKNKRQRIVECPVSPHPTASLLDLAYDLRTNTEADALIVGDDSLKTLEAIGKPSKGVVPLSDYRNSGFEKDRQRYEAQFESIDLLPRATVDNLIIRAVRFSKWLRFYDPYIGSGNNTSGFRKGIEYVLSLWQRHGFFASQRGIGSVDIFTCSAERILDSEEEHVKKWKQEQNRNQHRKVVRELIESVESRFPWPVKLFVKDDNDANRIFHARYLESQHAIIRVDRGFDLFQPSGAFNRNFFTLNMAESSHLTECRKLPDAAL